VTPTTETSALRATLPVLVGYVPLGMAFGVLFGELGYPWYYATLMAAAVYAGAAQFLAVGLLAAGAGVVEIGLATLLLNARHMFYGLSMAPRFPPAGAARAYLIFGLTDETYSLLSGTPTSLRAQTSFYVKVTALNQGYWVLGCTLGALLGRGLALNTDGLEFVLTALFVVLVIEQAYAVRQARPFAIAGLAAALAVLLVGVEHMLLVALTLVSLLLLADRLRSERR
jgi:4-azaleucine resistance transporter AzlC